MKSDDQNRPQIFLGSVENVAARDIIFFGHMSEWTGLPAEALYNYRAQEVQVFKDCKNRRWSSGPFICMIVLALALSGIAISIVLRLYEALQAGTIGFFQAGPSIGEFIIALVIFVTLQIAQAMFAKLRREDHERASIAAQNIKNIDIELRRQGYGWSNQ